jgi:hypothetical protein
MMLDTRQLDELEAWLGSSVGDAYAAAMEIDQPGGTSTAWKEVLDKYGVSQAEEENRQRAAAATGMKRGAPVNELYEVLDNLSKEAEKRLKRAEYPDDNASERRWNRLRGVIDRMRDETMAAYRKVVMPAKTGGMFGAAMAAAQAKKGQPVGFEQKSESFVMRCKKCGAPRLKSDDFVCEYCDTPYAEG